MRARIPFRFLASVPVSRANTLAKRRRRRTMNGELFKNKSLKFAVNLKVHTERLAMLYNYYFFLLAVVVVSISHRSWMQRCAAEGKLSKKNGSTKVINTHASGGSSSESRCCLRVHMFEYTSALKYLWETSRATEKYGATEH